jgi:SAM-dependent methyltransferase
MTARDTTVINQYLAKRATEPPSGAILDFGCGKADVVRLLRERGLEAYGADIFWPGMTWGDDDGPYRGYLLDGIVREIVDGRIPFDDNMFDVIISEQVFEHVEDLSTVIAELDRVLKPDGRMYHQFPAREIWLEPHSKIPFAHRIPARLRARYLKTWRRLGLGRHPLHLKDPTEWAAYGANFIEEHCVYRSRASIEAMFTARAFKVQHQEAQNALFRAQSHPLLARTIESFPGLACWAFRALGCDCIEITRVQM